MTYPPNSRYAATGTVEVTLPDGRAAKVLRRRFPPAPERFSLIGVHRAREGERPDSLAAQYLGDPEQYWRIADANRVMFPAELTAEPGAGVKITLPEGVAGAEDAD
jgi:hypothetical protein